MSFLKEIHNIIKYHNTYFIYLYIQFEATPPIHPIPAPNTNTPKHAPQHNPLTTPLN